MASPETRQFAADDHKERKLYVFRSLVNSTVFLDELQGLAGLKPSRNLQIRRPGLVSATLINTGGCALPAAIADKEVEAVREQLRTDVPTMAESLQVAVTGVALYGSRHAPYIGIRLDGTTLAEERAGMIASLVRMDGSFYSGRRTYRPHLTVAQSYDPAQAEDAVQRLQEQVPETVELRKPRVIVNERAYAQV